MSQKLIVGLLVLVVALLTFIAFQVSQPSRVDRLVDEAGSRASAAGKCASPGRDPSVHLPRPFYLADQGQRVVSRFHHLYDGGSADCRPRRIPIEPPPLRLIEKETELARQRGGGWHAFRRAWAHQRKGLPVQDVAAAGGWHDVRTLQAVYQGADAEGMKRVAEAGE